VTEHQLITPRRNFLIRALGFTAAGATLAVPTSPQKRHLAELRKAIGDLYPECEFSGGYRDRMAEEVGFAALSPGVIVAVVKVSGARPIDVQLGINAFREV
jgi:hypothetical protein